MKIDLTDLKLSSEEEIEKYKLEIDRLEEEIIDIQNGNINDGNIDEIIAENRATISLLEHLIKTRTDLITDIDDGSIHAID